MNIVKCDVCKSPLNDWRGNVMIPRESFEGEIDDLQIWCKLCTKKLDREGKGRYYHNLWELSWVKEDGEEILIESSYAGRFSKDVKEKMKRIIDAR